VALLPKLEAPPMLLVRRELVEGAKVFWSKVEAVMELEREVDPN
jgi:hypothetical protein